MRIVLCADDYGLSPGIGTAIRDLIARGRLTATSCMTGGPHWPAEAALLKPLRDRADVGLHLTLTDQAPLGPMPDLAPEGRLPSLGALLRRALLRRLDGGEIAAELERQLDAFEQAMGGPPDHVDGHHHIHQLPVVRDAVAALMGRRLPKAWARRCDEPIPALLATGVAPLRAAVISLLGRRWHRLAEARGIPGNHGFRGVRDFTEPEFGPLFRLWLAGAPDGCLIMCHPGAVDAALEAVERMTVPRAEEYAWLAGDEPPRLLVAAGARLVRFGELG